MNEIIYAGKHMITFSVSRHAHNSWELIYCTSGTGRLSFSGGVIPYQAGDVIVIPPLIYHQNESESGFTNIHLNIRDAALNLKAPAVFRDDSNHFILDAFTAAFYHFSMNPGRQSMVLAAYANLLVSLVHDSLCAPLRNPIVDEIMNAVVISYPDENFELDQYLRSLHFNYDYLRKLFKREVGVTPHQFLVDTRLQAAAERLSATDGQSCNISDVAHLCGFREPLYFSKIFRKKFGVSPSRFQAQVQQCAVPNDESIKILAEEGA